MGGQHRRKTTPKHHKKWSFYDEHSVKEPEVVKKHSVKCYQKRQKVPKSAKTAKTAKNRVFVTPFEIIEWVLLTKTKVSHVTPFEIIEWVLLTRIENVSRHSEGNEHHEFCF